MKNKNEDLLVRIDERVKTIFNEIAEIKKNNEDFANKQYLCQTEVMPKILAELKLLKERPIGMTAFITLLLKKLF